MALKSFKPYTASRRFITMLDKSDVTKQTPEKALTESKKRTGGRNAFGEGPSQAASGAGDQRRVARQVQVRRHGAIVPSASVRAAPCAGMSGVRSAQEPRNRPEPLPPIDCGKL